MQLLKKIRILTVLGTRPEAVKMAPVLKKLAEKKEFDSQLCVTAQHRQLLDQVLNLFDIHPQIDLNLMRADQTLTEITTGILNGLEPVIIRLKPDWILVQGDTTSVMAASLLAYYHRVAIGHVEAGLRTGDKWQPFPEEINRRIAGVIADLHFAPTEHSRQNLLREGVPQERILVTGNTVIDALQSVINQPIPGETTELLKKLGATSPEQKQLILVTAHRRENFGEPIKEICRALRRIAEDNPEGVRIVYPVHLNPNIQVPVRSLLSDVPNITLLPPLDYLPMIHLINHAKVVLTDSGGIQEEATALKVPTLVLRQVTERPEGIETGILKLVGTDARRIIAETNKLLKPGLSHKEAIDTPNPYGDGHAAERIVNALLTIQIKRP